MEEMNGMVNCRSKSFNCSAFRFDGSNVDDVNKFCRFVDLTFRMNDFNPDKDDASVLKSRDMFGIDYVLHSGDWLVCEPDDSFETYSDKDFKEMMEVKHA